MDNQTHNSENEWVDTRLAGLVPPGDWHPDSKRALAQFLKRRDRQEAAVSPRWIRFSMAAAVLASIGLIVALLPWHALWESTKESTKGRTKEGKNLPLSEPQKLVPPAVLAEPTPPLPAPKPPVQSQPPVAAYYAAIQQPVPPTQQPAPPAPEPEQKPVERVGPGVTAPHVISPTPDPDYTDDARKAHIQGTVVLSVIVRADGTGKVDKVIRSVGYGLDEKAIEVFEKWRFAPATKDGKPVDVAIQVAINFHLY